MTTAPFGLYACFFAMGVTSSIVYICSLSVQTQYFPGKLLGVSYGLTQTGWGLGVILFSSVLHLVPIQLYPNVVYMSCSFLAGAGVLSAMLLDQREPEQYRAFGRKCLGDLQARWRRKGTETVGEYAHMTANSTTKMNSMVELETVIAKGDMKGELSAKASPNSFSGTFCHTSVVYLLLASFFFAAHV
jgi:MFS family permease